MIKHSSREAAAMFAGQYDRLQLKAASYSAESGFWQGNADTKVELVLPANTAWLALDLTLQLPDEPAAVFLCFDTADGLVRKPMPMSLKGLIREVVAVPADARQMWLAPLITSGEFKLDHCQLEPISVARAYWRMARRALRFFWQRPRQEWRQAMVSPALAFSNLALCYRRLGQLKARAPEISYPDWLARFTSVDRKQQKNIAAALPGLLGRQPLTVLIYPPGADAVADWQQSIQSVLANIGMAEAAVKDLTLVLLGAPPQRLAGRLKSTIKYWPLTDSTALASALPANGRVLLLPAGCRLAPVAIYWWLCQAVTQPELQFSYSDHDLYAKDGERHSPAFKPDWNPELSRSSHYTGAVQCIAAAMLADGQLLSELVAEGSQGLVLRLHERLATSQIGHIPALLWHQPASWPGLLSPSVLQQHLLRCQQDARVERNRFGYFDLHYSPGPVKPLVSVVIPTRDMLHLLQPCVDSVLHRTSYDALEILIVDNQSAQPETKAYFAALADEPRVRVLAYDAPFNYSAINNFAVKHAHGELICLLNNDTEVIRPDWLTEMVGQLQQPDVGVVGARLLFADNRVQHAGDAVGVGGCAAHMHFRIAADEPGYMARAVLSQDLSAVTAACLLTPKALFSALDGLNEQDLTVAFNDVDYCLRVRELGKRVIYTPLAELYHYESISRGKDDNPEKQRRAEAEVNFMQQRWPVIRQGDPFYNPNLNAKAPDFRISAAPQVDKPWQS